MVHAHLFLIRAWFTVLVLAAAALPAHAQIVLEGHVQEIGVEFQVHAGLAVLTYNRLISRRISSDDSSCPLSMRAVRE